MRPGARRLLAAAAAGAGLLAATEALLRAASYSRGPVVFDVGPSTGAYGAGFGDSEERPPSTFRWTGARATLDLPLLGHGGDGVLQIRYARFVDTPARMRVLVSEREVATFTATPGRFRVAELPVTLPEGPLRIALTTDSAAGDPGVALDWLRVAGGRFHVAGSVWGARVLVVGGLLIALAAGFSLTGAATVAGALALSEAIWAALDPFGLAHVAARTGASALLLTGAAALLVGRRPQGRWVVLIFLAGYLLKGAGLFYPSYFYNDVRNNVRYVQALGRGDGTLLERSHAAQVRIGVGYPRIVDGRKYAFPYSPVFFLPFTLLGSNAAVIETAMKHVVLAAAAAEVLIVFWVAGLVLGESSGLFSALVAACLPVHMSRLLLALWSTTGGHLLDTLLLVSALLLTARPGSLGRLAAFAALTLSALLTYVASLFNVGLFCGFLALVERRLRLRVLAIAAAAVLLTLAVLYRDFVWLFLEEILPAALQASPGGERASAVDGMLGALDRIRIFYGYGYPALALPGLVLLRRRAAPEAFRVIAAWALTFATLMALRALGGGLFKDLKEMELVAPLVALAAGASLEEIDGRGRAGRMAAVLVACGLVAFGLGRYRDSLAAWTSLADLK